MWASGSANSTTLSTGLRLRKRRASQIGHSASCRNLGDARLEAGAGRASRKCGRVVQRIQQRFQRGFDYGREGRVRSDIPPVVETSVMRALKREPEGRPANVGEWFSEFNNAFNGASITEEKGESDRTFRQLSKPR